MTIVKKMGMHCLAPLQLQPLEEYWSVIPMVELEKKCDDHASFCPIDVLVEMVSNLRNPIRPF
jgi:hypothetical protein